MLKNISVLHASKLSISDSIAVDVVAVDTVDLSYPPFHRIPENNKKQQFKWPPLAAFKRPPSTAFKAASCGLKLNCCLIAQSVVFWDPVLLFNICEGKKEEEGSYLLSSLCSLLPALFLLFSLLLSSRLFSSLVFASLLFLSFLFVSLRLVSFRFASHRAVVIRFVSLISAPLLSFICLSSPLSLLFLACFTRLRQH